MPKICKKTELPPQEGSESGKTAEAGRGRFLTGLLKTAGVLLALWLAAKYLLGLVLPFLLSLALARLMEPAVRFLSERLRLRRGFVSGICCLAFTGAVLLLLFFAVSRGLRELGAFAGELPRLLGNVSGLLDRLRGAVVRAVVAAPPDMQEWLNGVISGLSDRLGAVPGELMARLMSAAPELLSRAPGAVLAVVTFFISLFFVSASYPSVAAFLMRQVPEEKRRTLENVKNDVLAVLLRWLRAECLLCALTFAELSAAFLLMRIDYPVLLALVTALIDMLPVLGTGTVLIPWAAADLLTGEPLRALTLAVTYGAVTLVRSVAEPKLVGSHTGLPPAAALAAMYAGFRAAGVAGMVLSPLALTVLRRLNAGGCVRLWRTR